MLKKGMWALALAVTGMVWTAPAEAHRGFGFRVARAGARVAARGTRAAVRAPVRGAAIAGRSYYRAATPRYAPPIGYPSYRSPALYRSPSLYRGPSIYVSPRFVSPLYGRPSIGFGYSRY